jgi:hypothetical protein
MKIWIYALAVWVIILGVGFLFLSDDINAIKHKLYPEDPTQELVSRIWIQQEMMDIRDDILNIQNPSDGYIIDNNGEMENVRILDRSKCETKIRKGVNSIYGFYVGSIEKWVDKNTVFEYYSPKNVSRKINELEERLNKMKR